MSCYIKRIAKFVRPRIPSKRAKPQSSIKPILKGLTP